ncbi:BTAD domain-containing putative transcriptional regulator [Amycolatopsis sp. NPDC003861]
MHFRVLGPLEVSTNGGQLSFSPRQRVVLSMLLLEPNRVVAVERLVDAVWDTDPPSTAREQIQICVSAIRRTLLGADSPGTIVTRAPGYSIECTDEHLDLLEFDRLVASARQASGQHRPADAVAEFLRALALWRGAPLAGVTSELVGSIGTLLAERRLGVVEECVAVRLHLGHEHELVSELHELVLAHPFRERLRAHLMVALHRAGRRAEALETYRVGRRLLVEKLGLEPGEELRAIEHAILAGDTKAVAGAPPTTEPVIDTTTVPTLLPADIGDFVGRHDALRQTRNALCRNRSGNSHAVRIALVTGRPWIGKTTLAVHAAHACAEQFPDGQLFARLDGGTSRPRAAGDVLARFLGALGVPESAIPEGTEARAEMYRDRVGDRRVLVVLDDAASEQQVFPLLPGSPSCAVLVTSRTRLAGLPGATPVGVGALGPPEAVELVTEVIGRNRAAVESGDVAALVEVCSGEPLALRLAAVQLAGRPHWRVRTLVSRLAEEERRLDALSHGRLDMVATVGEVYKCLSPSGQRLIRRIGVLGASAFVGTMCAPLLETDADAAEDALTELVDAGLLDAERVDNGPVVFHLRGLLWVLARRLARDEPTADRAATLRRVFGGRWARTTPGAARTARGEVLLPACATTREAWPAVRRRA